MRLRSHWKIHHRLEFVFDKNRINSMFSKTFKKYKCSWCAISQRWMLLASKPMLAPTQSHRIADICIYLVLRQHRKRNIGAIGIRFWLIVSPEQGTASLVFVDWTQMSPAFGPIVVNLHLRWLSGLQSSRKTDKQKLTHTILSVDDNLNANCDNTLSPKRSYKSKLLATDTRNLSKQIEWNQQSRSDWRHREYSIYWQHSTLYWPTPRTSNRTVISVWVQRRSPRFHPVPRSLWPTSTMSCEIHKFFLANYRYVRKTIGRYL